MVDFVLSKKQQELKEGINGLGRYVIRPMSLEMDRKHDVPEPLLRNFMKLASGFRSSGDTMIVVPEAEGREVKERDPKKPSETNRSSAVGAEELAWADASLLLCLPGPGLGGTPIRATGTLEQKKRF